MSDEALQSYAQVLHTHTTPLLDAVPISVNDVEREIQFVSDILISTAEDCLPHVKSSNRHFVHESTLSALCKLSKIAWKKWKAGGRPSYGPLHTEKKEAARAVKKHVSALRARKERVSIQKRDFSSKTTMLIVFVYTNPKLCARDCWMTTNNQFLIQLLYNYFSDLASSRDNDASLATNSLETLEATSIIQDDQILDAEILVEEVEVALRLLKLGRSKGADGLSAEHLIYGGTAIVLWLKKIFNRPNFLFPLTSLQ